MPLVKTQESNSGPWDHNCATFGEIMTARRYHYDLKWNEPFEKPGKEAILLVFELMFHVERFFTLRVLQNRVMFHVEHWSTKTPGSKVYFRSGPKSRET
jgi:hypothetical protein